MIELQDNTYGFLLPRGDMVEVGDCRVSDFRPHIKLHRFWGESSVELSIDTKQKNVPSFGSERVIWEGRDTDRNELYLEMYPLPVTKFFRGGGFEFKITINDKPKSNIFSLPFKLNNLVARYQGDLKEGPLKEGSYRPPELCHSFVLRHPTKGGFVTPEEVSRGLTDGKAFHIPRPRLEDANKDQVWAEPFYDAIKGLWVVTIPQEFLEYAHYPITHVAGDTFGYTDIGGTDYETTNDWYFFSWATCPSAGDATHVSFYIHTSATDDGPLMLGFYKRSDSTRVGKTAALNPPTADDWNTTVLDTGSESVSAEDYWYVHHGEETSINYDNDANGRGSFDAAAYPATALPDPGDFSNAANNDEQWSGYITYTPSGAPAATIVPHSMYYHLMGVNR